MGSEVDDAWRVADDILFRDAPAVDATDRVPEEHFAALAEANLWGIASHLPFPEMCSVVEALASGCLATTFVWIQHHGLVRDLLQPDADARVRDAYLDDLVQGRRRAGIALAGLHPVPKLHAAPADDGWTVSGVSPWVTGWGMIDLLHVAARTGDGGTVMYAILDATGQPGLTATRRHTVAVHASGNVELRFDSVHVPYERIVGVRPYDDAFFSGGGGLRMNGSLALGAIGRCTRLIGPSALDDEFAAVRQQLDTSPPDDMFAARAAASELALRAANALIVHEGSESITSDAHGQRLAREALFLAVFGTRPRIRSSLLDRLGAKRAE
jgi:alkylation response protein AidB-like acyl-CoA dehydrogenase